ncbi:tetratricopeptide repeat protein [Nocardioides alcanivorans]|uniref:tetratricopeptide repeat protein n=1 Tax=Nocardioides alcanivorans TaxID=2897352 RepID=UPI001F3E20B4|nr:tetratricopeptide repeat protein [Nocardioides alcanivorans]
MNEIERADHLLDLGRAPEAEQLARTALANDPTSADAFVVLARALRRQDRHREAVTVARSGLVQDPESRQLLLELVDSLTDLASDSNRVRARLRRVLAEEARECAWRLVTVEPNWWVSHYSMARALLAGDRPRVRDALARARIGVQLGPNEADTHNLVGLCLDNLNQHDAARASYQEALRLDPQHAMAMNNLATLDIGFFRLRNAAQGFGNAVALEPGEATLRENLRVLTTRLAMRLLAVSVVGALLLAILLGTEAPWWARALLGSGIVAGTGWFALRSRSYLPRGMTLSIGALNAAISWRERVWLMATVVALACLCAMAFAPRDIAIDAGMGMALIARMLLVAAIVAGLLRALTGLKRR